MTNPERDPVEHWCGPSVAAGGSPPTAIEVLVAREVPLGGPRAMTVRRTLPLRERPLVGAWCFADHYGPDDVATAGGMDVAPHPHTGLQTVSWLFAGEVEHRDSNGVHALVRPGELNLMTGGRGICHSEVSTPGTRTLHGVQLWVALPGHARDAARDFAHHVPEPVHRDGAVLRVFLGALAGARSPVPTHSPLLGAEVVLAAGARLALEVDPGFEHGVLVDQGPLELEGCPLRPGELGFAATGRGRLLLANPGAVPARALLLGGQPFGEQIVMWWNFIARTHEEIVAMRQEWESGSDRFGHVEGYAGPVARLPAPALPNARLKARGNP